MNITQTTALQPGQSISLLVGDYNLIVTAEKYVDGTPFIQLAGRNCNLVGETPGEYALEPRIEPLVDSDIA